MSTTYRCTFAAHPEWLAECARQGWEYRPHRAVSVLPMSFAEALAWLLSQHDPFQMERAS